MKISVKVKTGGKETAARQAGLGFVVSVRARPEGGRANAAVLEALADYFNIPKTSLRIVSGHKYRTKIIELI